jgi:hypothetical protein
MGKIDLTLNPSPKERDFENIDGSCFVTPSPSERGQGVRFLFLPLGEGWNGVSSLLSKIY